MLDSATKAECSALLNGNACRYIAYFEAKLVVGSEILLWVVRLSTQFFWYMFAERYGSNIRHINRDRALGVAKFQFHIVKIGASLDEKSRTRGLDPRNVRLSRE